jgi:hypothetical protein
MPDTSITVEPNSAQQISVVWTPVEAGNYRSKLSFKLNMKHRIQVICLGTATPAVKVNSKKRKQSDGKQFCEPRALARPLPKRSVTAMSRRHRTTDSALVDENTPLNSILGQDMGCFKKEISVVVKVKAEPNKTNTFDKPQTFFDSTSSFCMGTVSKDVSSKKLGLFCFGKLISWLTFGLSRTPSKEEDSPEEACSSETEPKTCSLLSRSLCSQHDFTASYV